MTRGHAAAHEGGGEFFVTVQSCNLLRDIACGLYGVLDIRAEVGDGYIECFTINLRGDVYCAEKLSHIFSFCLIDLTAKSKKSSFHKPNLQNIKVIITNVRYYYNRN